MKNIQNIFLLVPILLVLFGCGSIKAQKKESKLMPNKNLTAADILGNPKYLAISYGGFRATSRDVEPSSVGPISCTGDSLDDSVWGGIES